MYMYINTSTLTPIYKSLDEFLLNIRIWGAQYVEREWQSAGEKYQHAKVAKRDQAAKITKQVTGNYGAKTSKSQKQSVCKMIKHISPR